MLSQQFKNLSIAAVALLAVGTLAACGGGGGSSSSSSSSTALSVAESVSVVEVNSDGIASTKPSSISIDFGEVAKAMNDGDTNPVRYAFSDAGTDYTDQPQNAYTYEPSSEVMDQANFLLCVMGQTGYDESTLLNTGNFVALVDSSSCEKGGDQSGDTSGNQSQSLATWVVNSSRASDADDHIVKVWADETSGGKTMRFFVRTVISEGSTTSNPYGTFTMQFGGRLVSSVDGSVGTTALEYGFLSVGDTGETGSSVSQIRFDLSMTTATGDAMRDGAISGIMISDLDAAGDSDTGRALISMKLDTNTTAFPDFQYDVAYDADVALLLSVTGVQACISKASFQESVWRYALFYDGAQTVDSVAKADGERVDLNSGFPFTVTASNGMTEYGYVGYWGVFMPNGDTVTDGAIITRETFGQGTGDPYTIVKAPGKLIKFTKEEITAANLDGVEISYWNMGTGKQIKLVWNNGTSLFVKTAEWVMGGFGGYWDTTITTPIFALTGPRMYFMYSEQLGGDLMFQTDGVGDIVNIASTTSGSMPFRYNVQEVVSAKTTAPTTLYCLTQCLPSGMAYIDGNFEYLADKTNPNAAAYAYTYIATTMSLNYDGTGLVVDFDSAGTTGNGSDWGTRSGPMVTTDPTGMGLASVYDLWDQDTFYQWETGPNSWNTYTAVMDSSNVMQTFDKPLAMNYTHLTANDRNGDMTFDSSRYMLEYGGFGDLWGIPWAGSGTGGAEEQRWYPLFAIKDGTQLTDSDSINYVVKALDLERKPNAAPGGVSDCSGLDVSAGSRPAAGSVTFDDPGDSTRTNYIGARPDPDPLDVKVVEGVLS